MPPRSTCRSSRSMVVRDRHADACDLHRQGQGRGARRAIARRRDRPRDDGLRAVADPAAQPREGLRRQGHRPHRADPRDLRPPRAHARGRAAGRARPSRLPEEPARALLDPSRAPARRLRLSRRPGRDADRGRPAADPGAHHADRARPRNRHPDARPAPQEPGAACRIRSSRSSATPTPASRRCSTG